MNKKKQDGLFISSRQLSGFVAGGLFVFFIVFMSGYFVGKNQIIDPFIERIEKEAFADQVFVSFLSLNRDKPYQSIQDTNIDAKNCEERYGKDSKKQVAQDVVVQSFLQDNLKEPESTLKQKWYAPLIGYGSEPSANAFASKLLQKGYPVLVKTHKSITTKNHVRRWYQVVTEATTDKVALQEIVDKIVCQEKLKDVHIIKC